MKKFPQLLLAAFVTLMVCCPFASADDVYGRWPDNTDRIWISGDFWPNRLQDWRISNGRLECVESSKQKPIRVAHLLTSEIDPSPGTVELIVELGAIDAGAEPSEQQFAGFLVGCGSYRIDHRLSALAHHRPAEDGGILCVVNGRGQVALYDFSRPADENGNQWSITGALGEDTLTEIKSDRQDDLDAFQSGRIKLIFRAMPAGRFYQVQLLAQDAESGQPISELFTSLNTRLIDGSTGLVSNLGPAGSSKGHWFRNFRVSGSKSVQFPDRTYGPILNAMHTLSRGTLSLTAQMPPLGNKDSKTAELQIQDANGPTWKTVATSKLVEPGYTFPFKVKDWDSSRDVNYRVLYKERIGDGTTRDATWTGMIRRDPANKEDIVVAGFTGHKIFTGGLKWNHDGVWFPHNELVDAVFAQKPDVLFFSGDQVYEGDLTGAQFSPPEKARLDYLDKWYRWCWAFRDLTRDIPAVVIPDDHDVYHGNIWGAGGKKTKPGFNEAAQDSGGYKMPAEFVRMVETTQTSHLPSPADADPVEQGIGVYFTDMVYGGVSFAVIEDRKFKSSPTVAVPDGKFVNGWSQNPDFDPLKADVPGAKLLGERQLKFLENWSADWSNGVFAKCVLSQTIFANVATLPSSASSDKVVPKLEYFAADDYPDNDKRVADADSNGWPQAGRNRALAAIRKGYAFHLAGDQHLGSCIQYGIENWGDAGFALCVPSVANTWPRRWYPKEGGKNRADDSPRYTGDFRDGFGNLMTVRAVSNPVKSQRRPERLYDRAPGYGIVRFKRKSRDIHIECWPRWADPTQPDAKQYTGWPIVVNQRDQYASRSKHELPTINVQGMTDAVVQVLNESGDIEFTVRVNGTKFRPKVLNSGTYTIRVGDPDTNTWAQVKTSTAAESKLAEIVVKVEKK